MEKQKLIEEIQQLIRRYNEMLRDTTEADVTSNLVEPLIALLGWDIYTSTQYSRQKYVRGAGYADITLLIDNEPAIFVEVKKFGKIPTNRIGPQPQLLIPFKEYKDLIDRTPEEKQAMKYARSKGIKWAVLTNFECLYVFNADREQIILSFTEPAEYIRKIDDLLQLQREKIGAKSLEWIESLLKKTDIDRGFLEKLQDWRLMLAQDIYDLNKERDFLASEGKFDFELLMSIVQRILSRLLVIQIADDREVLHTHDVLISILESYRGLGKYAPEGYLYKQFLSLCHEMDKVHNTSIFAPGHPSEDVLVSDSTFSKVIESLVNISFRKMSSDVLGATYESYIGYRFTISNGKIQAEIDQRVRKQGGIYYTPPYIVHYIVDNTLGRKLIELENKYGLEAGEKAKDIKLLDPACGSGSFLICAFDVLSDFYERINKRINDASFSLTAELKPSTMFERLEKLKHLPKIMVDYPKWILENQLYGVDLDPAAAEIATINLVVKAFEKMKDKKLPLILNQNIKIGNSLVSGIPLDEDCNLPECKEHISLREQLKRTEDEDKKIGLMLEIEGHRESIDKKLNESLKECFESLVDKRPFNWQWEFPEVFQRENRGFDIVIGNPPYINVENLAEDDRKFYRDIFYSALKRFDIYIGFIERGIHLLSESGQLSMIIPYPFLTQDYGEKLRKFILDNCIIKSILDLSQYDVFPDAVVRNIVPVFHKEPEDMKRKSNKIAIITPATHPAITWEATITNIPQEMFESMPAYMFRISLEDKSSAITRKIEAKSLKLGKFVAASWGARGVPAEDFHLDKPINKFCKPMVKGRNVGRYSLTYDGKWFLYDVSKLYRPAFPELFEKEKIIVSKVTGKKGIIATYDDNKFYTDDSLCCCVPKYSLKDLDESFLRKRKIFITDEEIRLSKKYSLKYLLAIVNSTLVNFYYAKILGYELNVYPESIEMLPVYQIDFSDKQDKAIYKKLTQLVDRIMLLNSHLSEFQRTFAVCLNNYSHELKTLKVYYESSFYSDFLKKKVLISSDKESVVTYISSDLIDKKLLFRVKLGDRIEDVLELTIDDKKLRLFLFYSARTFLKEHERKKKWGEGKVLRILLDSIKIPIFNSVSDKTNIEMIESFMKEFKKEVKSKCPRSDLNLSNIEAEIADIDATIDAVVFKLYKLTNDEIDIVLPELSNTK